LQEQAARFCLASEHQSGNLTGYDEMMNRDEMKNERRNK